MKIEVEKIEVHARHRQVDLTGWKIEEGEPVSVVSRTIYEMLAPDLHARIVKKLGHDCYFSGDDGEKKGFFTGDPFDPDTWEPIKDIDENPSDIQIP